MNKGPLILGTIMTISSIVSVCTIDRAQEIVDAYSSYEYVVEVGYVKSLAEFRADRAGDCKAWANAYVRHGLADCFQFGMYDGRGHAWVVTDDGRIVDNNGIRAAGDPRYISWGCITREALNDEFKTSI